MKQRAPTYKKVMFENTLVTVYAIGWLALLTNRTPQSVRLWERRGLLPKPLIKLKDGQRWYLAAELEGYSRIYKNSDIKTGVSIYASDFGRKAAAFHDKLRAEVAQHTMKPLAALPNHDRYIEAFLNLKDQHIKQQAKKIIV